MTIRHAPHITAPLTLAAALALEACGLSAGSVPIDRVRVRVRAQDVAWRASYLVASGGREREIATGREIHLPLGAQVTLRLESRDYICIFAAPGVTLRDFASPGLPGEYSFRADHAGRVELRGDEMCGQPHGEETRGWLIIEDPQAFQRWVSQRSRTFP